MIKTIVYGTTVRYSTENFSHQFEVRALPSRTGFICSALWNNRYIASGSGSSRIEAIEEALNDLQKTVYRMPFATYRMADILTGQL